MLWRTSANAFLLLLLVVGAVGSMMLRGPRLWTNSQFYLRALSSVRMHTISPYACQLVDSCDESLWRMTSNGEQILFIIDRQESENLFAPLSVSRPELYHLALGGILLRAENHEQAARYWREREPRIAQYVLYINQALGVDLKEHGNLLRLSLGIRPTMQGNYELGNVYLEEGETQKALLAYQTAVEMSASSTSVEKAQVYIKLGRIHLQEDAPVQAQGYFERALLHVKWTTSYVGLGQSLIRQGRLDDAIAVLQDGVAMYPESRQLHQQLAQTYLWKGELDEAYQVTSRLIALDRKLAPAWRLLSEIETARGNTDAADVAEEVYDELRKDLDSSEH